MNNVSIMYRDGSGSVFVNGRQVYPSAVTVRMDANRGKPASVVLDLPLDVADVFLDGADVQAMDSRAKA